MKSMPFNPKSDLPPIPFTERVCVFARNLKENGLVWDPHPGCFVWDPTRAIKLSSPFPNDIYFVLNVGHFEKLLGNKEAIRRRLVWIPTWYQARLLLQKLGASAEEISACCSEDPEQELLNLYTKILNEL
ncbi:hypothetical protein ACX8XP_09980 [Calditrichota bacterium LG25]